MITGVISIALHAEYPRSIYLRKGEENEEVVACEERELALEERRIAVVQLKVR